MSDSAIKSLRNIFSRLEKSVNEALARSQMEDLGHFAVDLVVKRTRLGYGVDKQFGTKSPLQGLTLNYIKRRKKIGLDKTTSARKSNLTNTGQLLRSVDIIDAKKGSLRFGPTGRRADSSATNLEIADFQERKGRIFNRISQLEFNQILREYRITFGDLLRKNRLLR
ncbi:MAG TPA: hypothetical protein VN457_04620 [Chlamydiales bacterium]|nr:hypothetical protein [Chlamydiales bacterium]